MKKHHVLIGAVVTVLLLVTGLAYAQGTAPERETKTQAVLGTAFTYQGRLKDADGPVDRPCNLTFELYDSAGSGTPPTGGTLLSTVAKPDQDIVDGIFTVELDFGSGVFNGDARWLQVSFDCGDAAGTFSPRQALTAAPYAVYASEVGEHDHWGEVWEANSGIALRAQDPAQSEVARFGDTGGPTVYGKSANDTGVRGVSSSNNGVDGSSTTGSGVYGTSDQGDGVFGRAFSSDTAGVYGVFRGTTGFGYGVEGFAESSYGVYGHSVEYIGVSGKSDGSSYTAVGVHGSASATSGKTYGVSCYSHSTSGTGVYGFADASSGTTYGVYGEAGSPAGYGVYGTNSVGGYAAYFDGDVHVAGTLSKSGGGFRIDHPLDPENQYLYHSFVESPDMMNVYNGNVATDDEGFATVTLPQYFEALNKHYRYQLTVIGAFAQAIIAEEIEGGQFVIQTDQPNVKVSWQVTGIRQDPYAEANRIPVEEEKSADEKGTYLYPEGYGKPEAMGLDYQRNADLLEEAPETRGEPRPGGSGD
jgi:hypothetical protein